MCMHGLLACLFVCLFVRMLVCVEGIFGRTPEIERVAELSSVCFGDYVLRQSVLVLDLL